MRYNERTHRRLVIESVINDAKVILEYGGWGHSSGGGGYRSDYSMSNRAHSAYENDKMPLSKWTKAAILDVIKDDFETDFLEEHGEEWTQALYRAISRCPLAILKTNILKNKEWHHTSKAYNKTDFYGIDYDVVANLTPEEIETWKTEAKNEKVQKIQTPTRKMADFDYIVWGGSLRRPKAFPQHLTNVYVEERGAFFYVFDKKRKSNRQKENWLQWDRGSLERMKERNPHLDRVWAFCAYSERRPNVGFVGSPQA